MVFDKTGTLTRGEPAVTEIVPADEVPPDELLRVALSIEAVSEHPLAQAIVEKGRSKGLETLPLEDFEALSGLGVRPLVGGKRVLLGNMRLMEQQGMHMNGLDVQAGKLLEQGKTSVFVAEEGQVMGLVGALGYSPGICP